MRRKPQTCSATIFSVFKYSIKEHFGDSDSSRREKTG